MKEIKKEVKKEMSSIFLRSYSMPVEINFDKLEDI